MYAIVLQRDNLSLIIYRVQKNVRLLGHIALMQRKEDLSLSVKFINAPFLLSSSHLRANELETQLKCTPNVERKV